MAMRFLALFLGSALLLVPADKKMPSMARGENLDLILSVTLYDDPVLVKSLLGNDLEGHYIVADVKVDPKYGKDIIIDRDDFVLRTEKDGEKTAPFAASQITGKGALILTQTKGPPAASPGMVLGGPLVLSGPGLGGGGDKAKDGQPRELPQADGPQKPAQDDPLKKLLDDKILPEKKTSEPVSGLLYFPMEKQKRRDLELDYGGRENRITLRFK
jgi:hypothetical protein